MQSVSGTVEAFRISVVVAGSNTVRDTTLCPSRITKYTADP